jgi:hypothetical protein
MFLRVTSYNLDVKKELTEDWRRMHNEELHDLCSSPNIIRVIKSRVKWARHVAGMRYRCGNPRERND